MKNFKRILDKSGQYRYYVNGKRITAKKGASQFVKQNFSQIKPEQLSRQEKASYTAKLNAQKGAAKAKERAQQAFRFKGKYLDKAVNQFLNLLQRKDKNVAKLYPGIKDYGQFLQQLQADLQNNLSAFALEDASQFGLPNEKRNRNTLENVAIQEALESDQKAAYTKFSYFPQINIVQKLLIIDLEEKDKESENRFSVETQYS